MEITYEKRKPSNDLIERLLKTHLLMNSSRAEA